MKKFKTKSIFTYLPILIVPACLLLAFLLIKPELWLKGSALPENAEIFPTPTPTPEATPELAATTTPTPTAIPTTKPSTNTTVPNNKLFKMNSINTWDTARPTLYPFGIYAYQPLTKVEFTFEGNTSEIQPINNGTTYAKAYKLKTGDNFISVTASNTSGQTQTETFKVINADSLSNVNQDLKGRVCSEADLQHCASYSKYTRPGLCKEYKTYILCLQSKCDVNTTARDEYCWPK